MLFDTSTCSAQAELATNGINKLPFVLSKLSARKLKGGWKTGQRGRGLAPSPAVVGEGWEGGVVAGIAPIPTFLAGRAFPCMGMPCGKRGVYAAKPLPHPRRRGKERAHRLVTSSIEVWRCLATALNLNSSFTR